MHEVRFWGGMSVVTEVGTTMELLQQAFGTPTPPGTSGGCMGFYVAWARKGGLVAEGGTHGVKIVQAGAIGPPHREAVRPQG